MSGTVTFAEETTPRRGVKASACVGDHYTLDVAAPAGVVVCPSTAGHVKLPTSAGEVATAIGVLVYDLVTVAPDSTNDFSVADQVEAVDEGGIWCVTEEALVVGSQPYCRHTANGAGKLQLGALRTDADTANAALLPNSRVLAVYGTTLAKVKVNLPHGAAA